MTEYMRAWMESHPGYSKKWREEHPEAHKIYFRKSRYGLSDEQFRAMLLTQCGKCAICTEVMEPPCVDHDKETGRVRGLLCHACNKGIGMLRHDLNIFQSATDYLCC